MGQCPFQAVLEVREVDAPVDVQSALSLRQAIPELVEDLGSPGWD